MRYQPKGLKSCFCTNFMSPRIAATETKNATAMPSSSNRDLKRCKAEAVVEEIFEDLQSTRAEHRRDGQEKAKTPRPAPRAQPRIIAPRIVEPERDVPGIIDSAWKQPIRNRRLVVERIHRPHARRTAAVFQEQERDAVHDQRDPPRSRRYTGARTGSRRAARRQSRPESRRR